MKRSITNTAQVRIQPTGLLTGASNPPKRVLRNPVHDFNVVHQPYQITPFMIAPVLPGETLENMAMNCRARSQPLRSKLMGWWLEHFFFFVPLTALDKAAGNTLNRAMLLDLGAPRTDSAADSHQFNMFGSRLSGVNWVEDCTNLIVSKFFRDGETDTGLTFGGAHLAKMKRTNWAESFFFDSEVDASAIDQTPTADIPAAQIDTLMQTWEVLRAQNLTDMTYEDYVASYGVRLPKEEQNEPVLLRYISSWELPSIVTNPADVPDPDDEDVILVKAGAETAKMAYNVQSRADKSRFFKEPGFVIGLTVWRPKVHLDQLTPAAALMNDSLSWLPAILMDKPEISLKKILQDKGPLGHVYSTKDHWVDLRDLLLYGDSFRNSQINGANPIGDNFVNKTTPNPENEVKWNEYPSLGTSNLDPEWYYYFTAQTAGYIAQDGAVQLRIQGTQVDNT